MRWVLSHHVSIFLIFKLGKNKIHSFQLPVSAANPKNSTDFRMTSDFITYATVKQSLRYRLNFFQPQAHKRGAKRVRHRFTNSRINGFSIQMTLPQRNWAQIDLIKMPVILDICSDSLVTVIVAYCCYVHYPHYLIKLTQSIKYLHIIVFLIASRFHC